MAWSIFTQGGGPTVAALWAADLLKEIGAPQSPGNLQMVYDWEVSEGGGGTFNPLNQGPDPSHPNYSGGSQYGGGAANYTSWSTGLLGAKDYLNMPAYSIGIKENLITNQPAQAEQSLWASNWASSHYGYGANWSNAPLPGKKASVLPGPGGTTAQLTADTQGVLTSNPISSALNLLGIGSDMWERVGLVIFGAILILIGVSILGFGPRALTPTSTLAAQAGRVRSINTLKGPSPEKVADRQERLRIAQQNIALGERKQAYREKKLDATIAERNRPRRTYTKKEPSAPTGNTGRQSGPKIERRQRPPLLKKSS